ncbi:MAG: TIGR00270 family protein [Candidatus Heimdallarchaeota archaeon]|nr:TIGR00270 family protein [Candidatus Heimdallarchaeota archaeon]MBY8994642.1 TIGR00270 family protein [Candidatus Heimdallarchaeota archaeon]
MSCEMCGDFAGPDLTECEVDGVNMFVCPKCRRFGTKVSNKQDVFEDDSEESEVTFVRSKPGGKGPSVSHVKVKTGTTHIQVQPKQRGRRDVLRSDQVLVDDYGEVIKQARKEQGLSLEQFAQMINEKASLIQKLEKSEFNPPESLIVKIERKLDISLKEEAAAPIFTGTTAAKETTLGDVVKLKKKKR